MIQPACSATHFSMANIASMDEAQHRSLQRLLQALLREGFLNSADFVKDGNTTWLPLWKQTRMFKIEGLELGRAGHCRIRGKIWVHQAGVAPHVINNANELLDYLW